MLYTFYPLCRYKTPYTFIFLLVTLLISNTIQADSKNTTTGLLDFNVYPYLTDVDNDSVFTLNIAANLNNNFSYFSLTNFYGQNDSSALEDSTTFYTEQNIRWQVNKSAFDITSQFNFRSGEDNDRHRLGFRWRLNDSAWLTPILKSINLTWSINFHLLQFDHSDENEWQMEHAFRMSFPSLSERLYLAGFIDHTFKESLPDNYPSSPIVAEMQLGWRIVENLYAVTEYRVNQYRRSDVNNIAMGIEYKLLW